LHAELTEQGEGVCVPGWDKIEKSYDYYRIIPTKWQDWNQRLSILENYAAVKAARGKGYNWYQWAYVLHKSPFASDVAYHTKLRSIIRTYNLNKFDEIADFRITSEDGKYIYWDGWQNNY
jgi:flagellum-specific peptidoglycan hydrolase FlgJ